ncbi:DUF413 domain-containing protein [candidate division KSB1 bacterium]|nr:DUF413 domain-containing protein [candidate division KSB1 bacterium]
MSESRPGFTPQEKVLLYRYYEFYRSLETGKRRPSTAAQKHFVAVCQGRAKAETLHEKAYAKYMQLRVTRQTQSQEEAAAQEDFLDYDEESSRPRDDLNKLRRPNFAAKHRQHRQAA